MLQILIISWYWTFLTTEFLLEPLSISRYFPTNLEHETASHPSCKIPLQHLYRQTSVPVRIKGAAGCGAYTIFHTKREGSHLIKKGRGKTLAGQWERSRIDQPVSLPHHIIFVWQHHPKVEVHQDFSWTERLTSNTRLKRVASWQDQMKISTAKPPLKSQGTGI